MNERYRLTEEQIKALYLQRHNNLDLPEFTRNEWNRKLADSAADKAVREALKDVGEWLDNSAYTHAPSAIRIHIARLELDAFKRGEMPAERPHPTYKSSQLPASLRPKGKEG